MAGGDAGRSSRMSKCLAEGAPTSSWLAFGLNERTEGAAAADELTKCASLRPVWRSCTTTEHPESGCGGGGRDAAAAGDDKDGEGDRCEGADMEMRDMDDAVAATTFSPTRLADLASAAAVVGISKSDAVLLAARRPPPPPPPSPSSSSSSSASSSSLKAPRRAIRPVPGAQTGSRSSSV